MSNLSDETEEYLLLREIFSKSSRTAEVLSVQKVEKGVSTYIGYEVSIHGYQFYLVCDTETDWDYNGPSISAFLQNINAENVENRGVADAVGKTVEVHFEEKNSKVRVNSSTVSFSLYKPKQVSVLDDTDFTQINNALTVSKEYVENGYIKREVTGVSVKPSHILVTVSISPNSDAEFSFSIPERPDPAESNTAHFIETVGQGAFEYIEGESVVLTKSGDYGEEIRPVTKDKNNEWTLTSVEAYNSREDYIKNHRITETTSSDSVSGSKTSGPSLFVSVVGIALGVMIMLSGTFAVSVGDTIGGPSTAEVKNADVSVEFSETDSGVDAELIDADVASEVYLMVLNGEKDYYLTDRTTSATIPYDELEDENEILVIAEESDGTPWVVDRYTVENDNITA